MDYMLDTHTFVWALVSPNKLSDAIDKILSEAKEEAFVSMITIWEISIKYGLGRMKLAGKKPDEIPEAITEMGFRLLQMKADIVSTFYQLPKYNKDPFDRMLAWQAINENFILLSKDEGFDKYKKFGLKRIW